MRANKLIGVVEDGRLDFPLFVETRLRRIQGRSSLKALGDDEDGMHVVSIGISHLFKPFDCSYLWDKTSHIRPSLKIDLGMYGI